MVATRPVTIEEFAAMPLEGIWELVDGEMIELTYSSGRSGWINGNLLSLLMRHAKLDNIGWVFPADTGFVLFDDRQTVRSPDVAVVLRTRLPEVTDSFVPLAPDLAVEILSPWDQMAAALSKIAMYLDAGVRLVWLVNPKSESVTVFEPHATPTPLQGNDILDGGDVLLGFSVPVSEIFA